MINLMLITSDPAIAKFAVNCGANRIFVDLEILGKKERQGHLSTLISKHTISDVLCIRQVLPKVPLIVRVNPYNKATPVEVNAAIDAGADWLMLPMFSTVNEIRSFCELVNGRAGVIPLVETPAAMELLPEWIGTPGISEIFIGLNDLHLGLGLDFIFQPLANGMVENMVNAIKQAGIPFGFGGIARIGEGLLSAELILAEHARLGSSSVILSRTFHRHSSNIDELQSRTDFELELKKLRDIEQILLHRTEEVITQQRLELISSINTIVNNIRANK